MIKTSIFHLACIYVFTFGSLFAPFYTSLTSRRFQTPEIKELWKLYACLVSCIDGWSSQCQFLFVHGVRGRFSVQLLAKTLLAICCPRCRPGVTPVNVFNFCRRFDNSVRCPDCFNKIERLIRGWKSSTGQNCPCFFILSQYVREFGVITDAQVAPFISILKEEISRVLGVETTKHEYSICSWCVVS